jgi:hypothetical protein
LLPIAARAIYPCMILAIGRPQPLLIVPLIFVSLAILVAIPVAASRGKLHIAGYIGLALAAFAAAMISGKLSGVHRITGTIFGLLLSILFFSAIATVLGSLAALAFYKAPKDPVD